MRTRARTIRWATASPRRDELNYLNWEYEYDHEDPGTYGTDNHRLMKYEVVHDYFGPISTVYYYYNPVGNVERVVTEVVDPEPGEPKYSATRMVYAINGTAVSYVMGEVWEADGSGYDITYGREFRYDGARQRYRNRELDVEYLEVYDLIEDEVGGDSHWSDYDGDSIYADFKVDASYEITDLVAHEPGIGKVTNPLDYYVFREQDYYHADQLGTTRGLADKAGDFVDQSTYTAFGEFV
ncbi:MAG: hypothetical protein KJ749_07880, partial [Planctomycetes bacterium]|nr:hypothetical protein [Planctomycetota bacterium]